MNLLLDVLTGALALAGAGFFIAGSVGLLRFPDVYARLHALTKADNLGLGLVAAAMAIHMRDGWLLLKLLLVWILAVAAAATVAQLVARTALLRDALPEEERRS